MVKWLVVIGVIGAIYFFFIKKKEVIAKTKGSDSSKEAQEMVECVRCGVYVELDEAIVSNGKYYCSKECLKGV